MGSVINLLFLLFVSSVTAVAFWNPVVEEKSMSCKATEVAFQIQDRLFSEPQILWNQPKHTWSEWELFEGFPMKGWDLQMAAKTCSVSEFRAQCIITDTLKPRKITQTINFLTGEFIFAEDHYKPLIFKCY